MVLTAVYMDKAFSPEGLILNEIRKLLSLSLSLSIHIYLKYGFNSSFIPRKCNNVAHSPAR